MMSRWLPVLVATGYLLGTAPAAADDVARYAETVWVNEDGSARVDIRVDLSAGTGGPVRLPLAWDGLRSIALTGIDGATAAVTREAGQPQLSIDFAGRLDAPATLAISGDVADAVAAMRSPPGAFGGRTFTYRFVNSTPTVVREVVNELLLPPGYLVTSFEESEPPVAESSTVSPFTLVARDGRRGVSLAARDLGLAGTTSVTFRFKARRVPFLVPLALLLTGAGYLIAFRRLVARPPGPR